MLQPEEFGDGRIVFQFQPGAIRGIIGLLCFDLAGDCFNSSLVRLEGR